MEFTAANGLKNPSDVIVISDFFYKTEVENELAVHEIVRLTLIHLYNFRTIYFELISEVFNRCFVTTKEYFVNLSILCAGMDVAWTSPMLIKLRNPQETPLSRPITEDEGGWIVSAGFILSIITLPFIGVLVDLIGRKYSILVICGPKIIAGLITIFATEVWMILVVRVINGVTDIGSFMIIMIYCTEIASVEIRGALGSLIPLFSSLGGLIILGVGPYISYRSLSILYTVIIVCSCIPLVFIPDTPYSLVSKGKIEEAEKLLVFLRESKTVAQEELKELSRIGPKQKFDKRELFRNKAYRKGLMIAVVMGVGGELIGFNCITFYLQTILEITNTNVSSAFGSVVIGCIQLISCIVTSIFSDRFGRRTILISTLFGMAMGMVGLGIFFTLKRQDVAISGFLNYLPVLSLAIINWCFCGGIGSQFFVLISELLDGRVRALITSIGIEASTITVFFLTKYTMEIMTALGSDNTFFVFGLMCVLLALFVQFFIPETKNKTISEIQRGLRGEKCRTEDKEENENNSRL